MSDSPSVVVSSDSDLVDSDSDDGLPHLTDSDSDNHDDNLKSIEEVQVVQEDTKRLADPFECAQMAFTAVTKYNNAYTYLYI